MTMIPKSILFFLFASLLFAQVEEMNIKVFSERYLKTSNRQFDLMRYVRKQSEKEFRFKSAVPEHMDLQKISFDTLQTENVLTFKRVGKVSLIIRLTDSLVSIIPESDYFFPEVTINLNTSIVSIDDSVLEFMEYVNINNSNNAFESKWFGFRWRSLNKTKPNLNAPLLTLGNLEETNQLYLEIKWIENNRLFHYRLTG